MKARKQDSGSNFSNFFNVALEKTGGFKLVVQTPFFMH